MLKLINNKKYIYANNVVASCQIHRIVFKYQASSVNIVSYLQVQIPLNPSRCVC